MVEDTLLLLPGESEWMYVASDGHLQLRAVPTNYQQDPLAVPWLLSPACPICARPLALLAIMLHHPSTPYASDPHHCCWTTPSSIPLTSEAASRSSVNAGGQPLLGVLPTSTLRRSQCSPDPPPPPTPLSRRLLRHMPLAHSPPTTSTAPPAPLRILSINCGGAAAKLPRLVALLMYVDPDIICLQEAAALPPADLQGLPYRTWHGPPIRGGGLITMFHPRRLHSPVPTRPPLLDAHALVVTVPLTPSASLSVANMHLPPSLPPTESRSECAAAMAALLHAPAGARILAGDLNDTTGPSSAWLRQALDRRGMWAGWPTALGSWGSHLL